MGSQALGSASELLGVAWVARDSCRVGGLAWAFDRGWTLEWMQPAGLHISWHAAWLEVDG